MEVRFAPTFICRLYAVYANGEGKWLCEGDFIARVLRTNVFDVFNYEVGIMK
jgi:hypothetical protein